VFHVEYPDSAPIPVSATELNADRNPLGVAGPSTVVKNMTLGGWVAYSDKSYETTPTKMAMETTAIDPRAIITNFYEKKS